MRSGGWGTGGSSSGPHLSRGAGIHQVVGRPLERPGTTQVVCGSNPPRSESLSASPFSLRKQGFFTSVENPAGHILSVASDGARG